jgi:N-formylglutamate amidohydrolase
MKLAPFLRKPISEDLSGQPALEEERPFDWAIFHVPHDSTDIPADVRDQIALDDEQLGNELLKMTDHFTARLFCSDSNSQNIVRAPVSRLVVDVERFVEDSAEPMAEKGMGVIYTQTSDGRPLRRQISPGERQRLLERYYIPHHRRLEQRVDEKLGVYGKCFVLDCHSFPSVALPYEGSEQGAPRPDICIGTDGFHTPAELAEGLLKEFSALGFRVALNDPFSGALVPMSRYQKDNRVHAVMIEINRNLYMDEAAGEPNERISELGRVVRTTILKCLKKYE